MGCAEQLGPRLPAVNGLLRIFQCHLPGGDACIGARSVDIAQYRRD
jgi:hypothetical protein